MPDTIGCTEIAFYHWNDTFLNRLSSAKIKIALKICSSNSALKNRPKKNYTLIGPLEVSGLKECHCV